MKIAIIGAGLSGLSCAQEFQRHGVAPDIFEIKNTIGDILEYPVVNLKIFDRFLGSPIGYLNRNYNLEIKPLNKLKKITMIGPNKTIIVRGNLGYIFYKGQDEKSLEHQLYSRVKIPIVFDAYIDALNIMENYDYIIEARGDCTIAQRLGLFTSTFKGYSRIATVLDEFNPKELKMWFNTEYSKQCYAYLLPYNKERGTLVLSINNVSTRELDYYWNNFLNMENIQYEIIETRDLKHNLGLVIPTRYKNIYFVGNAGGCMDSFMGFGFINAIESGIMAARSIIENKDYNKMMKPIIEANKLKHEYRKMINSMDNKDLDKLLRLLDLPVLKQIIYKNPLYKSSYFAYLLKIYYDYFPRSSDK